MTVDTATIPESPPRAGRHRVVEQKVIQPFIRWAGSKRRLVLALREWLPAQIPRYHEPFLGSGAFFFAVAPFNAILSDANTRLTRTYHAIKTDIDGVLEPLRVYASMYEQHGAPFYNHVRDNASDDMTDSEMAAWFIFMNKTNFNGLWRVNAANKYNVPAGKFANPPTVCDEEGLRACSKALASATIINCDFRSVEQRAAPGALIYFDPPYIPVSDTADFTKYTKDDFTWADQTALRDLATRLKKKGVNVILSNSDTPATRELYAGFEIREVERSGGMNSDTTKRQAVKELLIR